MNCCQCQGIEELFSQQLVEKELADYRAKGPDKTTRILTGMIQQQAVDGLTLLDIGGGVGAVQHALIEAGVEQVTSVEASRAYLEAARKETRRQGHEGRVDFKHGDFVALAPGVDPADIVTLNRVICCYHDMQQLVSLSAARARKLYGLVYPRQRWWVKIGLTLGNLYFRLRRSPFRTFLHPTRAVEALLDSQGFKKQVEKKTFVWQVVVFSR